VTAFAPFAYAYPLRVPLNPVFAVATFVGELLWVAATLASYARDPAGRMWILLLASRVVAAIGVIWVLNTSLTWTLWQLSTGLGSVVFAHLVLAFPGGRLERPFDRRLIVTAYAVLLVSRIGLALVWDPRTAACFPLCQVNPFVVWPSDELTALFGSVAVLTPLLAVGVVVSVWRRWRSASPALRRTLLPVAVVAPIELGLVSARAIAAMSRDTWESVGVVLSTSPLAFVHAAIPAAFLAGLLATRLSRGTIADLAVELGQGVPIGGLRDALARAMRDPTLVLAFPAPGGSGYVDAEGHAVELPAPDAARATARLERDGELLAVLDYDPAIELEDPGRVSAVGSVAGMALENERAPIPVHASVLPQRLEPEAEVAAYYVVAETVTNAVKHAGATEVRVEASLDADRLSVTVADNGRGGADPGGGSGLQGLIDRVVAVGGSLTIDSPPGGGTTLRAIIPTHAR
jgi:hypothetical protein